MSTENKTARWKVGLGYGAFAVVALIVCFFLTFPYETLRRRLVTEAANRGYALRIASLRPGLYGLTATHVKLSKVPEGKMTPELRGLLIANSNIMPGPEDLGEPLQIQVLALRPTLFPPGGAVYAEMLGGTVSGSVGPLNGLKLSLKLSNLDTTQGNLDAFTGLKLEGKVTGGLTLNAPPVQGRPAEPDLSQAEGQLVLGTRGLTILGGTIMAPVYGQLTPVDLPRVALGDLEARIRFEKGMGTLESFQTKSEDLELKATGTLRLARQLELSEPNVDLKLRAEPPLLSRLGVLSAGLSILPVDREDSRFRVARLSGVISRPNFGPARF